MNVLAAVNKPWVVPVAIGVAGTAGGFIAGYKLGQKNMDNKWEDRVNSVKDWVDEKEQEHSRDYDVSEIDEVIYIENSNIEKILEDAKDKFQEWKEDYSEANDTELESESTSKIKKVNVFKEHDDVWNEQEEMSSRIDGQPYIIHETEYMENAGDWPQETLTYYVGDDIVTDQSDTPMYGYSTVLGSLNFGHGANDPDTVYIRNPQIRKEYEVLRHSGHYAIEILGHNIEKEYEESDLKHSNDRKFRSD